MNWQPIKTAPKDGTVFLAYDNPDIVPVSWKQYSSRYLRSGFELKTVVWPDESSDVTPTHWMPLPEPPK